VYFSVKIGTPGAHFWGCAYSHDTGRRAVERENNVEKRSVCARTVAPGTSGERDTFTGKNDLSFRSSW
jgi:hypothetical protein